MVGTQELCVRTPHIVFSEIPTSPHVTISLCSLLGLQKPHQVFCSGSHTFTCSTFFQSHISVTKKKLVCNCTMHKLFFAFTAVSLAKSNMPIRRFTNFWHFKWNKETDVSYPDCLLQCRVANKWLGRFEFFLLSVLGFISRSISIGFKGHLTACQL